MCVPRATWVWGMGSRVGHSDRAVFAVAVCSPPWQAVTRIAGASAIPSLLVNVFLRQADIPRSKAKG